MSTFGKAGEKEKQVNFSTGVAPLGLGEYTLASVFFLAASKYALGQLDLTASGELLLGLKSLLSLKSFGFASASMLNAKTTV
jgi:hypothetical protein